MSSPSDQPQEGPGYNRTSRVAAWNAERRQASARVAEASGIDSSPPRDEEPWHLQEPLYRDHAGFPVTRGMMEQSVRESRLRFSDNFTQMDIPFAGSPDEQDQDEQPRLEGPRLEETRLDRQYDREAQPRYQSHRRDPEFIREVQAAYQARHYQEYTRRLRAEHQPSIEQHGQRVEAQHQFPLIQHNSEFQTEVEGSRVQRYPRLVQAENRSRLNEEHHSESQSIHQAPQASHLQQYPRVLRGQNQTCVRQPYQSHFHAAHQPRETPHAQQYPRLLRGQNQTRVRQPYQSDFHAANQPRQAADAQQYPRLLRGQNQPRVWQQYSPHFRGPLHQARHVHQYHQGVQSEYQTPDERQVIPGREISLTEALRMDRPPPLAPFELPSATFAYSSSNYSDNAPPENNMMDLRTNLHEYRAAPRPSVPLDRLGDMPRNGHGPGSYNHVAGVNSADGFNGNPLVTIIPPAPETQPTSPDARTSNSDPMMLDGENCPRNDKKKKFKEEIKEKATKAKNWLLQSARDNYGQRGL